MGSTSEASLLLNETDNLSPPMVTETSNINRITALEKKMKELYDMVSLLQKKNFMLEKIVTEQRVKIEENITYITNQDIYNRRNNVEFNNIPENIDDSQLENYILKLLKEFNMDISSYDIVAVHRLGKKTNRPRNVIVRFLNRKDAYKSIKLNQRLKESNTYKRIFVTENLCPINRKIFNALYKLKKSKVISAVWSYNGNIFYRIEEEDDFQQAQSIDDIQFLFDDMEDNNVNSNVSSRSNNS